jgi:2-dehydro-3-deoxy-D-arabinonate dehydratase
MQLVRLPNPERDVPIGVHEPGRGVFHFEPDARLAELLRLSIADLRSAVERVVASVEPSPLPATLLAPIDGETEVWAAGVTYRRSEAARIEESATPDIYSRVYSAERPELFFKATARRVSGPDAPIAVRTDSTWDVPEPELALVINAHAEVVGYTIANDVSSRSIEGENPLYLPQAKVWSGSCALGPGVVPAWEVADPYALAIHMRILRHGAELWRGQTSTAELNRRFEDLVRYLFLEDDFPDGVILSTGTALVPEAPFTLHPGDIVEIEIDGLGMLRNTVVRGKANVASNVGSSTGTGAA